MVTRKILIRCNNDLTQCFDRILCHLAQVNNQSYGLPIHMATIIGDFLKGAIYSIKTAVGISDQTYSHSKESSVFGTGQGSVQSMYAWGMIVSRLIDLMDKYGHGATYKDPMGRL